MVPASIGLVCIDLDPGHDEEWVAKHLPPTLTVKTPRGFHRYYRCSERFGNGSLGPHIDVRSANGYALIPPSILANGRSYTLFHDVSPVDLPDDIRGLLHERKEQERTLPIGDYGEDNDSNIAKARMMLKNTDPSESGYVIACRLRRDIGLSTQGAFDLFWEWSETLDWPWDVEKIWSLCRNAGRYGNGSVGEWAGAGVDAYPAPLEEVWGASSGVSNIPSPLGAQDVGSEPDLDNTARGWLKRDLIPSVPIIGPINSTSRVMLVAPTGAGKTHVAMAIGVALAAGRPWINWPVPASRRVLYIDGEMPRALMKERLVEALGRVEEPELALDNLVLLSLGDYPGTPYLNESTEWVNGMMDLHRPNLIILDNVQALTGGDQKDTAPWRVMLPWMRSVSASGRALMWVHHANESGGMYGDKTRSFQLDTVIEFERSQEEGDIALDMKFTKHRELHPRINKELYAAGTVKLDSNKWVFVEETKVGGSIIERALEGEYGTGISTADLVKRMIDVGDPRAAVTIKKWINRSRMKPAVNRYVIPGVSPVRWRIPYNFGTFDLHQPAPDVPNVVGTLGHTL